MKTQETVMIYVMDFELWEIKRGLLARTELYILSQPRCPDPGIWEFLRVTSGDPVVKVRKKFDWAAWV
jgi:hypothetical protein